MQSFFPLDINSFPELAIIPHAIWKNKNLFNSQLLDWQKDFLRATTDNLSSLIVQYEPIWENDPALQNIIIIIIALKFRHLSAEQIMQFKTILKMSNEALLLNAYIINHQGLIEFIENKFSQNQQLMTILRHGAFRSYDFFEAATTFGHTHLMDHLLELLAKEHFDMVQANEYAALKSACDNYDTDAIDKIITMIPEVVDALSETYIHNILLSAIAANHHELISLLFQRKPELIDQLIASHHYKILGINNKSTLELVLQHRPEILKSLTPRKHYDLIFHALMYNDPETLSYLFKQLPDVFTQIVNENLQTFYYTNYLDSPNFLVLFKLFPVNIQLKFLRQRNYKLFDKLCLEGNVEFVSYIMSSFAKEIPKLMLKTQYSPFVRAAFAKRSEICKLLLAHPSINIGDMLSSSDYMGGVNFVRANIEDEIIPKLIAQYPELMKQLFVENPLAMFNSSNQILFKLKLYQRLYPDAFIRILHRYDFHLFILAAETPTPEAMQLILEATPELNEAMLMANDFQVLKIVKSQNNLASLDFLKQFEIIKTYLQINPSEFGLPENDYISQQLNLLRQEIEQFNRTNPGEVFDINPRQRLMFYYMLKSLIITNHADVLDALNLLMSLPRFRETIHLNSQNIDNNEIFQLASRNNNIRVVFRLWREPRVAALQRQTQFLFALQGRRAPNQHFFQAQELPTALDRESAMKNFNDNEQKRYQAAIDHYQPMIHEMGEQNVLNALESHLERSYHASPAQFENSPLPLTMADFNKLGLSSEHKELALIKYYQHPIHTAWRLLQIPNPWIHPSADFCNADPKDPKKKWPAIEPYRSMIAMLYLAASDTDMKATDDFTIDSRTEHFFNGLSYITRGHNWDNYRHKLDRLGNIVLDANSQPIEINYDDLGADRPSCPAGIKRRLFDSIIGHPLFKCLTPDLVKQEIDDFVRAHVSSCLNSDNAQTYSQAWQDYIVDMDADALAKLKSLDVPYEKQQFFIDGLCQKYSGQFTLNSDLHKLVEKSFLLKRQNDAHVINFPNINFANLIQEYLNNQPNKKARF